MSDLNSQARPDCLFALLSNLTVRVFGQNELAVKIWPVLFGSASVWAIACLIRELTRNEVAALFGAGVLAVLPLHVWLSTKALPDVIAVFFLICALIGFARLSRLQPTGFDYLLLGGSTALAVMSKATALYLWVFLCLITPLFVHRRSSRRAVFRTLLISLLPLVGTVTAAKLNGGHLSFFEEPTVRSGFGFTLERFHTQFSWAWLFYGGAALPLLLGVHVAAKTQPRLLVLLIPVSLIAVTPFFRNNIRELLYIIPSSWPLVGLGAAWFTQTLLRRLTVLAVVLFNLLVTLCGVAHPGFGPAWSERSTALFDRPPGWPSNAITKWVTHHLEPDEGILVTGLGFTDPFVLSLRQRGSRYYSATSFWELLRNPASKIKYVVFVDDPTTYAAVLYRYARTHFQRIQEPTFAGYVVFDCRKDGQFVPYPDALNSAKPYANEAARLAQQGNYQEAIRCLLIALQQEPELLEAKKLLMICYINSGQKTDALRIGREISLADPRDPDCNLDLAVLCHELGMISEGIAQCHQNIQYHIHPAINYGILGQLLEQAGQFQAAQDAYESSLKLDPHNPVTQRLIEHFHDCHPEVR